MEDRGQTSLNKPAEYQQYTCPTCRRRVRVQREDRLKLPKFYPFCCERCKLIDLGAWLDAKYRIPSRPDEESEPPVEKDPSTGGLDSSQ